MNMFLLVLNLSFFVATQDYLWALLEMVFRFEVVKFRRFYLLSTIPVGTK